MITHNNFILASSSNSRNSILKKSGFVFKRVSPLCDEEEVKNKIKKGKKPSDIAKILSYEKAKSISSIKKYSDKTVIGCDTLIYIKKSTFNKAKNMQDAKNKIIKLSGKTHRIVTGITLCVNGKKTWQSSTTTLVKIRKLSESQIDSYLKEAGRGILTSVGCYQIELLGPKIIEDIRGDFFNVMGLPLFKLLKYVYSLK